jgi:hypothetical protein
MHPDHIGYHDDCGHKFSHTVDESAIYHRAFSNVLKGLNNSCISQMLTKTQMPSNPYTTDEVAVIIKEAALRLK